MPKFAALRVSVWPSLIVIAALSSTGASLTAVIVPLTVAVSVPPLPSLTV